MKDIGSLFLDTREAAGLSIEEVSSDLNLEKVILENIEDGKTGAFQDIFALKKYISNYAKYLGLDGEKILDEFNEYLFDMTSKIPIELIKEAKKDKNENNDTISPYTKESSKIKVPKIIIGLAAIVILIVVGYFIVSNYKGNDFSDNDITYSIRR